MRRSRRGAQPLRGAGAERTPNARALPPRRAPPRRRPPPPLSTPPPPRREPRRGGGGAPPRAGRRAGRAAGEVSRRWPPVVDAIGVERGYEAALGAALGEDLDASVEESAPAHWSLMAPEGEDPPIPPGAEPLSLRVTAPDAL